MGARWDGGEGGLDEPTLLRLHTPRDLETLFNLDYATNVTRAVVSPPLILPKPLHSRADGCSVSGW